MIDQSTQNRYDVANELGIPNEYINVIKQIDNLLFFQTKGGASYSAKVTKTGKLQKHSVRLSTL